MSIYHENKSLYTRMMAGDGTALTDTSGALSVHTNQTHYTSEILASTAAGAGEVIETDTIDFGEFGKKPDNIKVYVDNASAKSTSVIPMVSYNSSVWISGATEGTFFDTAFCVSMNSPALDRYLKFAISNDDVDTATYGATASWYQ